MLDLNDTTYKDFFSKKSYNKVLISSEILMQRSVHTVAMEKD